MSRTVYMKKNAESGAYKVELFRDKEQTLGRCRGKGDYIVVREDGKIYRVQSMTKLYREYKSKGFKVTGIC